MAWRWEAWGGVAVGKTLAEDANEFNGLEQRSSDQDPASRALMKELRSKNRSWPSSESCRQYLVDEQSKVFRMNIDIRNWFEKESVTAGVEMLDRLACSDHAVPSSWR